MAVSCDWWREEAGSGEAAVTLVAARDWKGKTVEAVEGQRERVSRKDSG